MIDLNEEIVIRRPTAAPRRRSRSDVPSYLRSDFPQSKWIFAPTEVDLLMPAACLDISRIPRRRRYHKLAKRKKKEFFAPPQVAQVSPNKSTLRADVMALNEKMKLKIAAPLKQPRARPLPPFHRSRHRFHPVETEQQPEEEVVEEEKPTELWCAHLATLFAAISLRERYAKKLFSSAASIQCGWRVSMDRRKRSAAILIINRVTVGFLRRRRVLREKREAVEIIKFCIHPLARNGTRFRSAVKTFRDKVVCCQRFAKKSLLVRKCRLFTLCRMWNKLEGYLYHCRPARGSSLLKNLKQTRRIQESWRVTPEQKRNELRRIFSFLFKEWRSLPRSIKVSEETTYQDARLFATTVITHYHQERREERIVPVFRLYSKAPRLIKKSLKRLYHEHTTNKLDFFDWAPPGRRSRYIPYP